MFVSKKVPLSLKWGYFLFLAVLIPTYWIKYGPANFLWFSDVTLFLAFLAVVTEKKFIASMAIICGFALELFWTVNFVSLLVFDFRLTGLVDYMVNPLLPLWLRLLSLFHLVLPPLLLWLILKLGYDTRAWKVQIFVTWGLIGVTWLITDPVKNINWVFNYLKPEWSHIGQYEYLIIEASVIAGAYVLTHGFLIALTKSVYYLTEIKDEVS